MSETKSIGYLFGSFNPVHTGHLIIAEYMVTRTDIDRVEFVVSPQNPLKSSSELATDHHRLRMVEDAVEGNELIGVNDVEFRLPKPSYTIAALDTLRSSAPELRHLLIMGSDSLAIFQRWKDYERILNEYGCYVYMRPGYDPGDLENHPNVQVFDAPLLDISATYIRGRVENGDSIRYLVADKVREYIHEYKLYQAVTEQLED